MKRFGGKWQLWMVNILVLVALVSALGAGWKWN